MPDPANYLVTSFVILPILAAVISLALGYIGFKASAPSRVLTWLFAALTIAAVGLSLCTAYINYYAQQKAQADQREITNSQARIEALQEQLVKTLNERYEALLRVVSQSASDTKIIARNGRYAVILAYLVAARPVAPRVRQRLQDAWFSVTDYDVSAETEKRTGADIPSMGGVILGLRPTRNVILYSRDAKQKAEEVRALVSGLVAIREDAFMSIGDYVFSPSVVASTTSLLESHRRDIVAGKGLYGGTVPILDKTYILVYLAEAPPSKQPVGGR